MFNAYLFAIIFFFPQSAISGVSAKNLTWRDQKWDLTFDIQPEDDSVNLNLKSHASAIRKEQIQIFFPTVITGKTTPQLGFDARSAKFDYKDYPCTIEPARTLLNGKHVDGKLSLIGTISPTIRDALRDAPRITGLFSQWQLELPDDVVSKLKGPADITANIYISSGPFQTLRSDKWYPFDKKGLWMGFGANDSSDLLVAFNNTSNYAIKNIKAFLSPKLEVEKNEGSLFPLQYSDKTLRYRTNIEPQYVFVVKAEISRTSNFSLIASIVLAFLAFLYALNQKDENYSKIATSLLLAILIPFLKLLPNHPPTLTIYFLLIFGGYVTGYSLSTNRRKTKFILAGTWIVSLLVWTILP